MSQANETAGTKREQLIRQLMAEVRANQTDVDAFDHAVAERLGLNRTDHRCLDILERSGRITAGQLAEGADLTTGAVTAVLDRMERAGYVRRVRDTVDRRRVLIELTPKAHREVARYYRPLGEATERLLSRYKTAQIELILDFTRRGREMLAEHAARVLGDAPKSSA